MAGHNKWSKVKHRKAVVDKRRSKAWTMCARAIISAARQAGPDPDFNFALRQAVDEARYHNMPGDNIDRAIKKGAGGGEAESFEAVRYEGYGPGGVAVIVDALTNNRTRTAADVRLIFSNHGGKMGTSGCVSHQFDSRGRIWIQAPQSAEEALMEAALSAGALDVVPGGDEPEAGWDVLTAPTELITVRDALAAAGYAAERSELDMIPQTWVSVASQTGRDVLDLVEALEDNDDVKKVYTNAELPDDLLASLA